MIAVTEDVSRACDVTRETLNEMNGPFGSGDRLLVQFFFSFGQAEGKLEAPAAHLWNVMRVLLVEFSQSPGHIMPVGNGKVTRVDSDGAHWLLETFVGRRMIMSLL